MGVVSNLGAFASDNGPIKAMAILSVIGAGTDPRTVVAADSSGATWSVYCLDGYRRRTAGDVIVTLQAVGGDWFALGKIAADQTVLSAFTWGTGAPPTTDGLRKASNVWVGTAPDGTTKLYTDMTSAAPAPVTVLATDAATWVGAVGTRAAIVSSATQIATWYYGGAIASACSGKTVTTMRVTITRNEDAGPDGTVPLRLGLHTQPSYGQPSVTSTWDPQVQLAQGQTLSVLIPPTQAALLANGSAAGIVANGDTAYCEYAATAPVTITFG